MRKHIEENGYLILVNGSRKNSWASGGLRDSSNGLLTYILENSEEMKMVNIFDYYSSDIVTYEAQRNYYNDWLKSKR